MGTEYGVGSFEGMYAKSFDDDINRALATPSKPEAPSFSMWSMLGAGAKGVPAGGLEVGGAMSDLLSGGANEAGRRPRLRSQQDQPDDTDRRQREAKFFSEGGPLLRSKASALAPDPVTSHTADGVLFGLSKGLSKAVAAVSTMGPVAGGAALVAEGTDTSYQRLKDAGVDKETALKAGAVEGVISGVGAVAPLAGSTVMRTLGLTALGGPGAFMAQEALSKRILQAYPEEAAKHDPTDGLGLALSIAIPGVFAGAHIRGLTKSTPASSAPKTLADVVLSNESGGRRYGDDGKLLTSPKGAQGEMQVMPKTATDPGFGVVAARDGSPEELARVGRDYLGAMQARYGDDAKAMAAYNAGPGAVDAALKQGGDWLSRLPKETQDYVTKGMRKLGDHTVQRAALDPEAVSAARVRVTNDALARSLPDHPEAMSEFQRAADAISAGEVPRVRTILDDDGSIEARLSAKLEDHDAAVAEYATRPDSQGGKVLNTDIARELSPDYLKDRTRSAAVHEPSSAFIKRLYADRLQKIEPGDVVTFTSGGTGAGKTTAVSSTPAMKRLADESAIVYDTNMNKFDSAKQKVEQALAAGAQVSVVHVQRDAVEALRNGALPRAMRQEREFGTGRTVPIAEHAKTHRGAAEVVQRLADEYKNDPRVQIHVIDNTRGAGESRLADIDFVKGFDYNGLEGKLHETLDDAHRSGEISDSVHAGFAGRQGGPDQGVLYAGETRGAQGQEPGIRSGDGARSERSDGSNSLPRPDQVITGKPSATPASKTEAPSLDTQRIDALLAESPDFPVKLPGSEETMTVRAALARATEEAAMEAQEANLLQAALDCALGFGG